jgi:undecaprenyl-diphosphatase
MAESTDDQARPEGGPVSKPGPESGAGPLGPVDPANPASPVAPETIARKPLGLATMTVVVGFAALIAIVIVLGSIARAVRSQEVFALDTWATPFLHGIASPAMDVLMTALTNIGSSLVIVPIFAVVEVLLVVRKRYGAALFVLVTTGGSLVIQLTMKLFFERPRPQVAWATVLPDYSFPSGHTMNAIVFYIALALVLWSVSGRGIGLMALVIALVVAFGVGVSRIYLGYHYLTDVAGGILAGIGWLLVVGAAFRARPTWRRWRGVDEPATRGPDRPGAARVEHGHPSR